MSSYELGTFDGPLGEWAAYQSDYGHSIEPHFTIVKIDDPNGHRISYMRRSYIDNNGDFVQFHHLGCDCLRPTSEQNEVKTVAWCDSVKGAIDSRAEAVGVHVLDNIDSKLLQHSYVEEGRIILDALGKKIAAAAVRKLLENQKRKPSEWYANVVGLGHQVSLLPVVLNQSIEVVEEVIGEMAHEGLVEVYRNQVNLPQDF